MTVATVSSKGWIVIPADFRKKYGLNAGSRVLIVDYGGVLALVPPMSDPVAESTGMFKGGPSLVGALLKERAEEIAHEG